MRPSVRPLLAAALALAALLAPTRAARAGMPDDAVMDSLLRAARDTLRAPAAESALRRVALEAPPEFAPMIRHMFTLALITRRAPTPELLAVADSGLADADLRASDHTTYAGLVIEELVRRGERIGWADTLAHALVRYATAPGDWDGGPAAARLLARVFEARRLPDSAVAVLAPAVAAHPRLEWLSSELGYACELAHRDDDAIRHYLRADALAWTDTTISAGLRRVWNRRNAGLAGLADSLARARSAQRHEAIFVAPRVRGRAPAWNLPTLTGRRLSSAEFAGRVTVLHFWGTWCPSCIEGMPGFLALTREARWRDVAFLAVDCEPPLSGSDARTRVAEFVRQRGWTIAMVQDTTERVSSAYGVPGFSTTIVIDRAGRMRYRNCGGADELTALREQLALVLRERRPGPR